MAQNTPINFSLQARDWEMLIGIISNNMDSDIQEIQFALTTYYRSREIKPAGTDSITITTTEDLVVRLATFLYGNTVMNITKDSGTSPFVRIMNAIRAANNAADNYISTQLAAGDSNYNAVSNGIRKNGRRVILMRQYDNN